MVFRSTKPFDFKRSLKKVLQYDLNFEIPATAEVASFGFLVSGQDGQPQAQNLRLKLDIALPKDCGRDSILWIHKIVDDKKVRLLRGYAESRKVSGDYFEREGGFKEGVSIFVPISPMQNKSVSFEIVLVGPSRGPARTIYRHVQFFPMEQGWM